MTLRCPTCFAPATEVWAPNDLGTYLGIGECAYCRFTWALDTTPAELDIEIDRFRRRTAFSNAVRPSRPETPPGFDPILLGM